MNFVKVEEFDNLEYSYISKYSGGYISKNENIFNFINMNSLNQFILEKAVFGTPIFKVGSKGNKYLLLSGIHGDELPSQIASLMVLNEYVNKKVNGTLYFIPFASPFSTMENERNFHLNDLNRSAHIEGSLSNNIFKTISALDIDFVGDFHSTAINSNPGVEAIFSSKNPTPESFFIASYVSRDVGSKNIVFPKASASYKGAIEDECNLNGIPAITGEVVSPFGVVGYGSVEKSYRQIKSFLAYFGL